MHGRSGLADDVAPPGHVSKENPALLMPRQPVPGLHVPALVHDFEAVPASS